MNGKELLSDNVRDDTVLEGRRREGTIEDCRVKLGPIPQCLFFVPFQIPLYIGPFPSSCHFLSLSETPPTPLSLSFYPLSFIHVPSTISNLLLTSLSPSCPPSASLLLSLSPPSPWRSVRRGRNWPGPLLSLQHEGKGAVGRDSLASSRTTVLPVTGFLGATHFLQHTNM